MAKDSSYDLVMWLNRVVIEYYNKGIQKIIKPVEAGSDKSGTHNIFLEQAKEIPDDDPCLANVEWKLIKNPMMNISYGLTKFDLIKLTSKLQ